MNLVTPLATIAPGLDSAALTVLAGVDAPLSATQIQRLAGRGSRYGLVLVLDRLAAHGLVTAIPAARGRLYRLNRDHVLAGAVLAAAGARAEAERRVGQAAGSLTPAPLSVAVYGSVARGDATVDSDLDVLIIAPGDLDPDDDPWLRQIDALERQVRLWTGNAVQVVTVPEGQLAAMVKARDPLIGEWERDVRTIAGQDARALLRQARAAKETA